MGTWILALSLGVSLFALPNAAAFAPAVDELTKTGPTTLDPRSEVDWAIATATSCEEVEGTLEASLLGRPMGLHNDDLVQHHCRQWKVAAWTALAPVSPAVGTAGFLLVEPEEGAAEAEASARVEAVGMSISTAGRDVAPFATAPAYAPVVTRGPVEPAPDPSAAQGGASTLPGGARDDGGSDGAPREVVPALLPRPRAPADEPTERDGTPARAPSALAIAGSVALAILAALLYQRFAPHEALRHAGRAAVFAAVQANEGASVLGVARACDIPRKTTEYHLLYLARAGLVREHVAPGAARRWTTSAGRTTPTATDQLLALVRENPGISTARLAEFAGLTRTRVDRRVKELIIRGALEARNVDGERRFFEPA